MTMVCRLILTLLCSLGMFAGNLTAAEFTPNSQGPRNNNRPLQPPGSGPKDHQVQSASSKDGLTWTRDEGIRVDHASVPCALADGQRVLIYFVDGDRKPGEFETVGSVESNDGLNFKRTAFTIENMSVRKAVDPSIIKDDAGQYRLYYLASDANGDPASEPGLHRINLAASEDGIHFKEIGIVFRYANLVDPDVFRYRGKWFMYVFAKGNTVIATSDDGKDFKFVENLHLTGWGTTAPIQLPNGKLRLYAFDQRTPAGNAVRSFLSEDGLKWTAEEGVRLQASASEQITDPYVIPWQSGYKMYFKTSAPPPGRGGPPGQGQPQQAQFQGQGSVQQPGRNPGPWDADVIVYHSGAGTKIEKLATFERAGVPTIARLKDGRLMAAHQYFAENDTANFDKVAVHFSSDEGRTWTAAQVIKLDGFPEDMRFPFDPTLVPLPDGRVRLYFTSVAQRREQPALPAIHSAISSNGVDYTYEPGVRFGIEGRSVIDCAVVLYHGIFHLYAPDNGAQNQQDPRTRNGPPNMRPQDGVGYHATSKDGLNFTRQADVKIDGRRRWLGNAQSDGQVITFYGTGEPYGFTPTPGQRGGNLWMATSTDGQTWKLINSPLLMGADPGAVSAKDGSLIIITTGEPRPGTPSANRMKQQPRQ